MQAMRTLMQLPPEVGEVIQELHERLGRVLADPDPATIGARAAAEFADHEPAWRFAAFQSVDVQIAARDEAALAAGDYLAVVGDVHVGNNPLLQGVFAHRHANPAELVGRTAAVVGPGLPVILPPWSPTMGVEARGAPMTPEDAVHIAVMPETRAQGGRRTWMPHELELLRDMASATMDIVELRAEAVAAADAAGRFQRVLVPEPPQLERGRAWAAYRPGDLRLLLGGDFVACDQLQDGSIGVMIGDIVGHARKTVKGENNSAMARRDQKRRDGKILVAMAFT